MSIFQVDSEKCNRDGLCSSACPARIIEPPSDDALPRILPESEELCIQCGHCIAVCPTAAVSLEGWNIEACPPIRKDLSVSEEQVEQLLRSRRSIRRYKDKPVPRDVIERLIGLARYGPTGHNSQDVEWLVISDQDEIRRLSGLVIDWMKFMIENHPEVVADRRWDRHVEAWGRGDDRICRGAPLLVLTHGQADSILAPVDAAIALTFLDLAAPVLGLGSCWAGYIMIVGSLYPPLSEALHLPEGRRLTGAMMVGYPRFKYQRMPTRNEPAIVWR